MRIDLRHKHYWWGDCVFCETQTTISRDEPIDSADEEIEMPNCFQCGRSLDWNEGQ